MRNLTSCESERLQLGPGAGRTCDAGRDLSWVTILFFVISLAYVVFCERVR